MWKNQGSWNFFHAKLIPNSSSVFVSGVSGSTLGAKVDTAIGAWFGGVGAIPGAIIGGAVGGICGSFGASWLGVGTVDMIYGR